MDVKDFRVSNLVLHPVWQKPVIVTAVACEGLYVGHKQDSFYYPIGLFEAIVLNDSWLSSLGGLKTIGWDDFVFWRFDEYYSNIFELMELNGSGETKYESPSGNIIEHVHTLQNAYYFHVLSGKELTLLEDDKRETA
jgi:hypothetical protein